MVFATRCRNESAAGPARRAESSVVPSYFQSKRRWSRWLGAVLLLLALPVIGVLALLVRLTSSGPAIYRQRRLGLRGSEFVLYKIRTMRHNAEAHTGPVWCAANDRRVTPIGRFLRWSHLDELPQLYNVARGEMCLVGPRPERPEIANRLEARVPLYGRRLAVLPGITGLAQVRLPADSDVQSVRRKLALDLAYIRHGSLGLDLRILAATALKVVGCPAAIRQRLLRLDRIEPYPLPADEPAEPIRRVA